MVNVQLPVPVQTPLQPLKTEPGTVGAAVNVTVAPLLIADEFVQVPEGVPALMLQLIPPVPDTVPLPAPAPVTLTVVRLNVAVTDCAALMTTLHGTAVPLHAPLQPANADPAGALGVRSTSVPEL